MPPAKITVATTPQNKRIALLIAALAIVLAFSETLGKSAQTEGSSYKIEASGLWPFCPAKTIRLRTVRAAGELLEMALAAGTRSVSRETIEKGAGTTRLPSMRSDAVFRRPRR